MASDGSNVEREKNCVCLGHRLLCKVSGRVADTWLCDYPLYTPKYFVIGRLPPHYQSCTDPSTEMISINVDRYIPRPGSIVNWLFGSMEYPLEGIHVGE